MPAIREATADILKASYCINKIFKKMETRNTPHTTTELHCLAKEAQISNYKTLSRPTLLSKLKSVGGLKRLQRIVKRHNNTDTAANRKSGPGPQQAIVHAPRAIALQSAIQAGSDNKKRKAEETADTSRSDGKGEKKRKKKEEKKEKKKTSTSSETTTKNKTAEQKINGAKTEEVQIALNQLDPIMLAPIMKKFVFRFERPNGTVVQFNIESLVDFMLASGDFHDPETRIPFTDENLKEIDKIAKCAGLSGKGSVLAARHNVSALADAKFRRDALLALERCAGESVTEMLNVVECCDPDDAEIHLVTREFPAFVDYFSQMRTADEDYASKFISSQILFMKGPPNRPNRDPYGLISTICMFLANCKVGVMTI